MSKERMDYDSRKALVFEAANEMAEGGQTPSLEVIKQKVGGSYTTITRALREWRTEREKAQASQEAPPEAVSGLAARLASELWKVAQGEAQMGVAALRESLKVENQRLQQEMAEILRSAEGMESRITTFDSQMADMQAKLDLATKGKQEAETQAQILTSKLGNLEVRAEELKLELADAKALAAPSSLQEEIQSLRAQLVTLSDQNAIILATAPNRPKA
ncbi:KfrA protein [Acidovorax sp. NO-1]|uniref:DNA-binding protein n=1 Tax=Acidovorax sp. NO-1 TaxID=512030 RepID=UPI00023FCCCE|nr:DNA-binding protein [Acidovorax sp. NO-1]EHL24797.1 KfrA protein [Acidovorax sp. NO-1]